MAKVENLDNWNKENEKNARHHVYERELIVIRTMLNLFEFSN